MREVVSTFRADAVQRDWLAAVDDDGQWRARELLGEADAVAAALSDFAAPNPTVLVQAENSRRMVIAALAVGTVGGTLALASSHSTAENIAAMLDAVRPDAIFGAPAQLDAWRLGVDAKQSDLVSDWQVRAAEGGTEADRWAGGVLIGMTSGSTGRSKGVVHRESALRYAVEQEAFATGLVPGDAIGVIVPISAAPAFTFGVYASLLLRSPALLAAKWVPAHALDELSQYNARWLMCVPTMVLQLSAAAQGRRGVLSEMRAITVGGGPMDYRTLQEAEENLGTTVLRVFGMSECLGHTTPRLNDPPEVRLGQDGRPFPGTDLRIVDEKGDEVGVGVIGRAQVKGPSLFMGYADGGRLEPATLTPDGYLETGDLMMRNEDGTVKVSGRIKDVIIRGGRNISIPEVEGALLADERIESVCVVSAPDPVLGERVAALVVADEPGITLESVTRTLERNGFAKINWPEYLVQVSELPMTHVGKVSRNAARDIVIESLRAPHE